jgi:hypothetical protein
VSSSTRATASAAKRCEYLQTDESLDENLLLFSLLLLVNSPLRRYTSRRAMGPTTLATAARPAALPGRQLGRDASCSSLATARLARAARFAPRGRRLRVALAPRALDRDRDGGIGGDGGELNMNVLAERMKALKAKEASENAAVVDAAIERDQAIVAGIRGDAAERPTPERASSTRHPRYTHPPPSLPARSRGGGASALPARARRPEPPLRTRP